MIRHLTLSLVFFAGVSGVANGDSPPISADGYCLVSTVDSGVWIKGESTITSDYRGRRFHFLSHDEKAKFDEHPERYAPMLDGNDPILACDSDQLVVGKRGFGVRYKERTFFFASLENMEKFNAKADHFLERAKDRQRIEDKVRELELKRARNRKKTEEKLEELELKRGKPASTQSNLGQSGE
ncbi:hypothetical protein [Crateriforma spongiae]|uniref:hypothetical protein n=1 Tax=Crateriforma spongiae TaxID=2724528 RepID=UPI0039B00EF8